MVKHFNIGIKNVLKQIHPDFQLRDVATKIVNDMILDLAERLIKTSISIAKYRNTKIITPDEIKTSVMIIMSGSLMKHALIEANNRMTTYKNNIDQMTSREKRAVLQFNISTTEHLLQNHNVKKIDVYTSICLTAILEYITAEILELSGDIAIEKKFVQIKPEHIKVVIRNDIELDQLFDGLILGTGIAKINHMKPIEVIKDAILKIDDNSIKKLLYRVGIPNISDDIYTECKKIIIHLIEELIYIATRIFNQKGKVLTHQDGIDALKLTNIDVYTEKGFPGLISPCKNSVEIKKAKRPSTEINRYQASGCTLMPHSVIQNVIKALYPNTNFTSEYAWLLQAVAEDYLINILQNAMMTAEHYDRAYVTVDDILLVYKFKHLKT